MNHITSNAEITTMKIHLLSALNGVRIRRYEYNNFGVRTNVFQTLEVPLKYGHKTRQIHEAVQINGHIELPIISVTMGSISLDTNRNESKKHNMNDRRWGGNDGVKEIRKPVPINLDFDVKIVTTKGSDLEEILAHYLSIFNPYIQLSWKEPHTGKEIVSKVTWDGSVNMEMPTDVDSKSNIRYIASFGITMEGWIYRGNYDTSGIIKAISVDVGHTNEIGCKWFADPIEEEPDNIFLNSQPSFIEPEKCHITKDGRVVLWGESMNFIRALFIEPIDANIPVTGFNPFQYSETLSASNPPFSANMIEEFDVIGSTSIEFDLPKPISGDDVLTGSFDVLALNPYTGMSRYTITHNDCSCDAITATGIDLY